MNNLLIISLFSVVVLSGGRQEQSMPDYCVTGMCVISKVKVLNTTCWWVRASAIAR